MNNRFTLHRVGCMCQIDIGRLRFEMSVKRPRIQPLRKNRERDGARILSKLPPMVIQKGGPLANFFHVGLLVSPQRSIRSTSQCNAVSTRRIFAVNT
jgi:hypothetical protein